MPRVVLEFLRDVLNAGTRNRRLSGILENLTNAKIARIGGAGENRTDTIHMNELPEDDPELSYEKRNKKLQMDVEIEPLLLSNRMESADNGNCLDYYLQQVEKRVDHAWESCPLS